MGNGTLLANTATDERLTMDGTQELRECKENETSKNDLAGPAVTRAGKRLLRFLGQVVNESWTEDPSSATDDAPRRGLDGARVRYGESAATQKPQASTASFGVNKALSPGRSKVCAAEPG